MTNETPSGTEEAPSALFGVLLLDNVVLCYDENHNPVIAFDNDLTEEQSAAFDQWISDLVNSENNRLAALTEA